MNNKTKKQKNLESTQSFLVIDEIKEDIVIMKDTSIRAVLMVSSLNMELRTDEEQESIIASFQSALNSLGFPLQIIIQSRKINLSEYLTKLENAKKNQTNQLLREQTESYILFLNDILSNINVMDKRFYVVIPQYPNIIEDGSKSILSFLGLKNKNTKATHDYNASYKKLEQKIEITQSFLGNIGLTISRLPTEALVELFYSCYNPETTGFNYIKNLDNLGAKYISTRKKIKENIRLRK